MLIASLARRGRSHWPFCKKIANILKGIKLLRPDLRLHGFGLKALALECPNIRDMLFSCDSMAWSYPRRFAKANVSVQNQAQLHDAHLYQKAIAHRLDGAFQRKVPITAGAGNGQGR